MADNQTKKERLAAEKAAQDKEMAKYRTIGIITAVFIVLALALIIFVNSNVIYTAFPAVTVGGKNYSAAEVNIAYVTEYNSYYSQIVNYVGEDYAAQFMPSTTESLKTQVYSESTGETWYDFFKGRAIESLKNYTALEAEAKKEGYTLSEEGKQSVEDELASLDTYIELYRTTYNTDYLQYLYGNGANRDIVKRFLELQALAGEYYTKISNEKTYSDAELDAKYAESADDYDYYTYTVESVAANVQAAGESATQAEVDAAMAEAKTEAESTVSTLTAENSTTTQGTYLSDAYKEWLTSADRKSGDTAVFAYGESAEDSTHGYYAIRFESRDNNNYTSKNVYFLAVSDLEVNEDDFEKDENGEIKDTEAYEAAQQAAHEGGVKHAEEILEAWNAGRYDTAEALAEAFADYTDLSRALENVGKNDISDEVNEWMFDSSRKAGDAEIFEISGSTYVFIFTGDGETYSHSLVESELRSEDMEAWSNSLTESLTATEGWAARFIGDVYMERQAANS